MRASPNTAVHSLNGRFVVMIIGVCSYRRLHGGQEERFFHGYYGHYCHLPLYVFSGRHLLLSYLRPSGIDGARHGVCAVESRESENSISLHHLPLI